MKGLTDKQQRVLDFLRDCLHSNGIPPTMREIGAHFGFNFPAARGHLKALENKGFIKLKAGVSRGIELLDRQGPEALALPVAGEIRAGRPLLARQEIESRIYVDRNLFRDENSFALTVIGDSMVEAGILDGDYVVVRPGAEVRHGQIGVALIGDEATVKRIEWADGMIRLVPENHTMEPVEFPESEVRILGRVTGVVRKL
jgi:repressor LexA